jgi:hypothetical protein
MTYFAGEQFNNQEVNIVAQSDESVTSSTTLQDDDELFFSAEANAYYDLTLLIIGASASATPDIKFGFTELTGADWIITGYYATLANAGAADAIINPWTEDTSFPQPMALPAGDDVWFKFRCSYITAGTSGTVYFRWAQNTSNATATTRKLGSHMIVRRVG